MFSSDLLTMTISHFCLCDKAPWPKRLMEERLFAPEVRVHDGGVRRGGRNRQPRAHILNPKVQNQE